MILLSLFPVPFDAWMNLSKYMRYKRKIGSHKEPIFQMCYKEMKEKLAEGITAAAKKDQQPDPVATSASATVGIVVEKTEAASAASTTIVVIAADRE